MKRLFVSLIGCLLLTPGAFAAKIEFEARLWTPDLGGGAQVGEAGAATAVDLGSDLGFADDDALAGQLTWRPTKRVVVQLDYSSFDFAGEARLDQPVTFGGTTFQLDAQASSLLQIDYGGIGIAWQVLSTGDRRVRFGPLVEARGLRGEAGITAQIQGLPPLSAREEFELAFAAAGVVLDVEPTSKVHIRARWTTSVEADEGKLTDAEASIRFYPVRELGILAGYRTIEIDFDDGGDRFDLELDGPFFGAVLRY